ncbi:MAG: DNA topoisomerase III, partial [Tannerella sp.]|nr:DNA topoisomerase III [Tannerella sp.]
NPTYRKQFKILESLIQNAEEVINCGDAGQEGELIQRWVMQRAGCKCPVRRLWVSSLTEEAIREGFRTLKDQAEYQNLYEAGLSRAIGDWILGMNATRLYTLRYGQNKQVLSIGRVQTPTLALIVKRQKEIENFNPEPYWELKTVYRETTFSSTQGRFSKKEEGEELLQKITDKLFTVTDITIKKGKEYAPRLFDLTSLQVECNRKFAFSADDTLKLIQSLYEKKITTYPRVDTTFLSEDLYPKTPQILNGLTDYATLTAPLLAAKIPKSKKVFDNTKVTDHHAIIPTGVPARNLMDNERKVYDLVARRFIAVFYPDCEISTTTVLGEVEEVKFKVTGKQILRPGWRVVFEKQPADKEQPNDDGNNEQHAAEDNAVLPEFTKGESGPHKPDFAEKWTTPPKPYTEATLLRAMETAGKFVDNEDLRDALKENGIGRPSTRAAIIETLFKRNYIRKERKNLYATPTGVELIDTIREELLKSAELTGLWENKLRKIEQGVYEAPAFLNELKEMVGQIVQNVLSDRSSHTITINEESVKKASQGDGRDSDNSTKKSPDMPKHKKSGQNAAKTTVKDNDKATVFNSQTVVADNGKSTIPGNQTIAGINGGSSIKTEAPVCPLCKKGTILRGKTAYGCSEYINGCTFRLPYESHGEGLSDRKLNEIIKNYTN